MCRREHVCLPANSFPSICVPFLLASFCHPLSLSLCCSMLFLVFTLFSLSEMQEEENGDEPGSQLDVREAKVQPALDFSRKRLFLIPQNSFWRACILSLGSSFQFAFKPFL